MAEESKLSKFDKLGRFAKPFRMYTMMGMFLAPWLIEFPQGTIIGIICAVFWMLPYKKTEKEKEHERFSRRLQASVWEEPNIMVIL